MIDAAKAELTADLPEEERDLLVLLKRAPQPAPEVRERRHRRRAA